MTNIPINNKMNYGTNTSNVSKNEKVHETIILGTKFEGRFDERLVLIAV